MSTSAGQHDKLLLHKLALELPKTETGINNIR